MRASGRDEDGLPWTLQNSKRSDAFLLKKRSTERCIEVEPLCVNRAAAREERRPGSAHSVRSDKRRQRAYSSWSMRASSASRISSSLSAMVSYKKSRICWDLVSALAFEGANDSAAAETY